MRRRRHLLVTVLTVALTAGAASAVSGSAAGAATNPADAAIAQTGVVTLADLPAGYTQAGSSSNGPNIKFEKLAGKISTCKGLLTFIQSKDKKQSQSTAKVDGPDFELGDTQVSSQVKIYATTKPVDAGFAVLQKPATDTCMAKLMNSTFTAALAQQAKTLPKSEAKLLKKMTIDVTTLSPVAGDQATGYRTTVTIPALSTSFTVDMVFIGVGRSVASYLFMNLGGPLPFEATVVAAATTRLTTAIR